MATKYNSSNNALLASAQNSLDNIEAKLANNMNTEVSSNKYDSVIKSSDSDSELNKLKSKIEIGKITIAGTNKSADSNITLPSKIVDVFAEPILEKINDTSINEYSKTNYWKQCLQQVMNALNKIDSKVEKNNGISYKIDYDNLTWSMNGIGTISATVTWTKNKTNYETKLSWLSLDKEALQSYYDSLNQLGNALINDVWKKLITGLASDVAKGTSKVIKALYGNDTKQNLLKEVFGNKIIKDATKAKLKAIIKEIFSNTNTGTTVISNAEKYEDLVYLYSSLESAINNNEDTSKIEKDFIDKANTIEKSLGITTLTTLNTSEAENKYLTYNKGMNQITVPSGYGNELKSSDYNSKVTKIDASGRTAAIIIEGNKKGNTIYGGSGKDSLNGGLGNDKLYGGAGDDTLEGGKGTDKLTGGDGSNVFYYSNGDGKDTILDYKAGQDKIQLGSNTTIKKVKMSGKNAIFTIGSGKITVKNVKGKNITVVDSNNNETTYLNGKVTSSGGSNNNGGNNNGDGTTKPTGESVNRNGVKVVIDDDTNGTFKLDEYNANKSASNKAVNIDASNNEQSLTIYGDDRDNIISAGSGSNTIYGGAGDDVLYSGSYSATRFYYNKGDGDDIIYDIKDNDYIGTNDCSVTDISVS
ncbi:MAG: hypothetical protein IJ563_05835, partial [Selenomonadaceae bacterium]|nr:hypothetical protein [Selenomonadaceae bacterium]